MVGQPALTSRADSKLRDSPKKDALKAGNPWSELLASFMKPDCRPAILQYVPAPEGPW
ncbi:hypothetical protein HMPREF9156_00814 [Scardovia wiggsiae F0424]|uniref:Uncharacterized protein n=1 Tax=Scardovia wiggsiae F0424 TaxID=857290 RepID=J0WZE8_9BIFI|nr:hypothetical protein HMPREF9156_00814 [Scardovia wiggsiae F0424]